MALAWSMVPIAWSLLLWIPELLIFGTELFSHSAPSVAASPLLFLSFKVAEAVLGCWALVLLLKSLARSRVSPHGAPWEPHCWGC